MVLLVLGVLLWSFAHLAKRVFPGFHRAMGGSEKPMVAGMLVLSIGVSSLPFALPFPITSGTRRTSAAGSGR